MLRSCLVLLTGVLALVPVASRAQSLAVRPPAPSVHHHLHLVENSSKPIFTVGMSGGFTGARMVASVYADGRVVSVRNHGTKPDSTTETHVPVSRGAIQAVLDTAVRHHVFAIPHSVQDRVFGADIPVLSFTIATDHGVRSVHVMGTEQSHPAGTRAFFPVWYLLYALAGYPPQTV